MKPIIPDTVVKALATFDTCAIANAIECLNVRLRNEGFTDNSLHCRFPQLPPMVGYAMTLRVRSGNPPMEGGTYLERTDWWDRLDLQPAPHILVIEDADKPPGIGAFVGRVHASIMQALGCVGVVTNGAVRGLPAVEKMGFQLFSGSISVSHGYTHVVEVNAPVTVAGLRIAPGDLLHGDRHGVVRIPHEIAHQLPETIARVWARETEILDVCRSEGFSKSELRRVFDKPS